MEEYPIGNIITEGATCIIFSSKPGFALKRVKNTKEYDILKTLSDPNIISPATYFSIS
ncbi:Hypothetical protein HVR_LOCUS192 [uncultured virus]|nr:Hypothetical protein HVR_LOCUS192 [uncultured virus]